MDHKSRRAAYLPVYCVQMPTVLPLQGENQKGSGAVAW